MGFIKAVVKSGARKMNKCLTNKQIENAPKKAYKQTGNEMNDARKKGEYINGSKRYKENKLSNINKAKEKGKAREDFISDY